MILSVTGHRPTKLFTASPYSESNRLLLVNFARLVLRKMHDDLEVEHVITGMALGWDQAVAVACVELGMPFTAAVPCLGQDSTWPAPSQALYRELLAHAAHIELVSDGPYTHKAMQVRNEWMVDNSQALCAVYDGTRGGTDNCVRYARMQSMPIYNVWRAWVEYRTTAGGGHQQSTTASSHSSSLELGTAGEHFYLVLHNEDHVTEVQSVHSTLRAATDAVLHPTDTIEELR